jgi:hypothetical protein
VSRGSNRSGQARPQLCSFKREEEEDIKQAVAVAAAATAAVGEGAEPRSSTWGGRQRRWKEQSQCNDASCCSSRCTSKGGVSCCCCCCSHSGQRYNCSHQREEWENGSVSAVEWAGMGDGGKDNRHGPARKRAGEGRDQTGNQYKCCPTAAVLFPSAYSGQYGRACMRPGSSCSSPLDTTLPHLKPVSQR